MILKLFKRLVLGCLLFGAFAFLFVSACGLLACSTPRFYTAALSQPEDDAFDEATLEELESLMGALELFVKLDPAEIEQVRALLAAEPHALKKSPWKNPQETLKVLDRSRGGTPDTFTVALNQRHIDAWLRKELGSKNQDPARPRLVVDGSLLRCAATAGTAAGEVVLSCDFGIAKQHAGKLTFEVYAIRVGALPLPAAMILKLYLQTEPDLPNGVELAVHGGRPMLTISAWPDDAEIVVDSLQVSGGEIHVTLRRSEDVVVAAR